ncbi:MAG: ABC transporter permease, partial [Chromatiales bacterium]
MSSTTAVRKTFDAPRAHGVLDYLASERTNAAVTEALRALVMPAVGIALFLALWSGLAPRVDTSLGELPGPAQVWEQARALYGEHRAERDKAEAFYARQRARNERRLAQDPDAPVRWRDYTGQPTFFDQILTSLWTVATGFILASALAIPIGIVCGMSRTVYSAVNPFIQVFKPVSPLAWLPLVTMVVSAVYVTDDPLFSKSYLN